MKNRMALLTLFIVLIPAVCFSAQPLHSAYLDGGNSENALILAHGRGNHPRWKVVNPLRKGINAQLGFHTLSLQLPNDDKNWQKYKEDFPTAFKEIEMAIRFLRDEKGVKNIYLMGHSMGSRMAGAFLAENPGTPLEGLIIVGCRNNGGSPFNCRENVETLRLPVLDLWGSANRKDYAAAKERSHLRSETYIQVDVAGANHVFDAHEDALIHSVVTWLQQQTSPSIQ